MPRNNVLTRRKINSVRFDTEIHESSLRITYNDKSSSLQKLLEKDKSVTMHQRNIKIIATYKIKILTKAFPASDEWNV